MLDVYLRHHLATSERVNTWTLGVTRNETCFVRATLRIVRGPVFDLEIHVCHPHRRRWGAFAITRRSSDMWQIEHGRHVTSPIDPRVEPTFTPPIFVYLTNTPDEVSRRLSEI